MKTLATLAAVAAVAAMGLVGGTQAGQIDAPNVICDPGDGVLAVDWDDLSGAGAEKYGVEFVCADGDGIVTAVLDMGTSDVADDCEAFGLDPGCPLDLHEFDLPILDLIDLGAASGDTCTATVKAVHKKNGNDTDDPKLQSVADRAECLVVIWARSEARSGRDFIAAIEDIFSDDRPGIQLSSVHKAKGLEADKVFILRPDLLPGPWATEGTWQYQQELHVEYVAKTRCSGKEMIYIS